MIRHRATALAIALAVSGIVVAIGPAAASATSADPLGCASDVFDPVGLVDVRVDAAVLEAEQTLDADVRVRAERSVDGGLDARIDQLVAQCDGWSAADGELADDMVVVLFSEVEREASVYYGADLGPELESRWSAAVDEMTAEFPDDYTQGVVDGLRTLRTVSSSSSSSSSADVESGSSSSGLIVVALIVIAALIALGAFAKGNSGGGSFGFTDSSSGTGSWWSGGTSGSSRRRRSSFGGFGSSSRSRSSGSSRSSSRGSRRAGGGTKKW